MLLHWLLPTTLITSFVTATDPRLYDTGLIKRDCRASGPGISNKLTIINATPFPFHRSRLEACQIDGWTIENTPGIVAPGETVTFQYAITRGGDAAADMAFHLNIDGKMTTKHFNIHVQGKPGLDGYTISAEVLGGLSTAGHGSDQGRFNFGDHGGNADGVDLFVLSGDELTGYGTVEPPVAWMSAMGPAIRKLSLKQLVLPASHDSGMSSTADGPGIDFNTRTQDVSIYEQLVRGDRLLDIRPFLDKNWESKKYRLGHFTGSLGAFGQTLDEAIADINRFVKNFPGELIIVDLNAGFQVIKSLTSNWAFNEQQFNDLLDVLTKGLSGVNVEYELTTANEKTTLVGEPIDTFYKKNASPVILRIPVDSWKGRLPAVRGNKMTGVIPSSFLPIKSKWSDTNRVDVLAEQQLAELRKRDNDKMFMSAFVLTLQGAQNIDALGPSIRSLASEARALLFDSVFRWGTPKQWPNLLQYDFTMDHQVASLAVAMNYWFALRNPDGPR